MALKESGATAVISAIMSQITTQLTGTAASWFDLSGSTYEGIPTDDEVMAKSAPASVWVSVNDVDFDNQNVMASRWRYKLPVVIHGFVDSANRRRDIGRLFRDVMTAIAYDSCYGMPAATATLAAFVTQTELTSVAFGFGDIDHDEERRVADVAITLAVSVTEDF